MRISDKALTIGVIVTAVIMLIMSPPNWPISGLLIFCALLVGKVKRDAKNGRRG